MADITSKTLAKSVAAGNERTAGSPAPELKTTIAEFKAPEASAVKAAEEKELAELQKEAMLRQAKEAVVPALLAQEDVKANSGKTQTQRQDITVITDGRGVVDILEAKRIAQELPKDESLTVKDGTGHQIDGLSSATATHGMNPEHALGHNEGRVV